jgi:TIR domain
LRWWFSDASFEIMADVAPKAFISYSWSSPAHQELVREWAERLVADGVDIVLDLYHLKEGQDKYVFMERMVTDPKVTHVLVICDKTYAEKADARKAGVGTESQIISKEVYEKVDQSKFIPIVCELDESGNPYLPRFFKSRIWIDFSTPEAVNDNWERLIRLLYGKPLHEKPTLGTPPVYIRNDTSTPVSPATAKFNSFRQALLQEKRGLAAYRRDFLDACTKFADSLRVRERPQTEKLGEKVLEDCGKLVHVRDHIVDWVLLESEAAPSEEFSEALIDALERLRELKSRPPDVNSWNDAWFEAHGLFVYETFLYIIAALIKTRCFEYLHNIFTTHYLLSSTARSGSERFEQFDAFYGHSETLNAVLAPEGRRFLSPAAELIKRQAKRQDIRFTDLMEADLLVLLMAFITPETRWYPQTLHYAGYSPEFPLFVRATQHKHFVKLAKITGIENADALREEVKKGYERMGVSTWHDFHFNRSFDRAMNIDNLDTLK